MSVGRLRPDKAERGGPASAAAVLDDDGLADCPRDLFGDSRAIVSVPPPGEELTISLIGRVGKAACAAAGAVSSGTSTIPVALRKLRLEIIGFPPLFLGSFREKNGRATNRLRQMQVTHNFIA